MRTSSEMNFLLGSLNIGLLPNLVDMDVSHNALGANMSFLYPLLHSAIRVNISDCGLAIEEFNRAAEHFSSDITFLKADRNYLVGYPEIERFKSLEILDLRSNRIPLEHLTRLLSTISRNGIPCLRKIYLTDNGGGSLPDSTVVSLCTGLARWRELEDIYLGDIGLSAIQTSWILQTIHGFPRITNLDFSYCRLYKAMEPIHCLKQFTWIKWLNITGNKLPVDIVLGLATALPHTTIINEED